MTIALDNGNRIQVCCAAGALGEFGKGYWWEKWILIPLRIINPKHFTIITKTITCNPRKGNLVSWAPWRSVRRLGHGNLVNAVGLTNRGLSAWCTYYSAKPKVILSLAPENRSEARAMAMISNGADVIGIELNLSCPNIDSYDNNQEILNTFLYYSNHPVGLKISYYYDLNELSPIGLKWITAINSIPWENMMTLIDKYRKSPLAKYGYSGAVSGDVLYEYALIKINELKRKYPGLPIMHCGGINTINRVEEALEQADAIQLGSVFLTHPFQVNKLAKHGGKYVRSDDTDTLPGV